MSCSNFESISSLLAAMDDCTINGLRADIARILFNICENDIVGLPTTQRNRNLSTVVLPAVTLTQYDISENVPVEIPNTSLVGETIVIQTTGLHRITYTAQFPGTNLSENRYFSVHLNGTETFKHIATNNISVNGEIYRRFDAGDIVRFMGYSVNGGSSSISIELEFLTQS